MKPQNYKFGKIQKGEEKIVEPFFYPDIWNLEKTSGPERLIIAPAAGQIDLIIELSRILPEPFGILYVLVVPRGGNEAGRYQSAQPAGRAVMEGFLMNFRDFFENDARHHIWVASLSGKATLVYDNHNVIYGYGELEKFKEILTAKGLTQSEVRFPEPHVHNYNPKFDEEESRILSCAPWKKFPLAESDH
ncbi:MAG: hypothetical protein R2747_00530 [Pyrinomonadaceae bacterium]